MKIRPWRSGDETAFEPRPDMAEGMALNAWDWSKGAPGPTWTLVVGATASLHEREGAGDQVLGIGGAIAGEPGAWLAWACLSDLPPRQWPDAVRLAGVVVDHVLRRPDVRWLWAQARADFPAAERLLRRLGFRAHHVEPVAALGCDLVCLLREG